MPTATWSTSESRSRIFAQVALPAGQAVEDLEGGVVKAQVPEVLRRVGAVEVLDGREDEGCVARVLEVVHHRLARAEDEAPGLARRVVDLAHVAVGVAARRAAAAHAGPGVVEHVAVLR